MADLAELLERVRAATGPDEMLAADICVHLQYGGGGSEGASNVRTDPDWEGELLFEIGTEDCVNPIPKLTASIDAALGLVERVLPGCSWRIQRNLDGRDWAELYRRKGEFFDVWSEGGFQATPALAILAALLSALIAQKAEG
jgi:hypothetical protein